MNRIDEITLAEKQTSKLHDVGHNSHKCRDHHYSTRSMAIHANLRCSHFSSYCV